MTDLSYSESSLFVSFFANTKAGADAYNVIAAQNDGVGKIYFHELKSTLAQLRKAGYTVSKIGKGKF